MDLFLKGVPVKLSKEMKKTLQELIDLVGKDNIQEIEIERGFLGKGRIKVVGGNSTTQFALPFPQAVAGHAEARPAESEAEVDEADGLHTVPSPMVGMFYRSSSPESPPFVEEGDIVNPGQTLCIIEAMKIMNEIEADVKGRVVRILVENSNPVEYNTPLVLLEPL